jgi:hypothetical protein
MSGKEDSGPSGGAEAAALLESLPADSSVFGESGINDEGDDVPARDVGDDEEEKRGKEEDADSPDDTDEDEEDSSEESDDEADDDDEEEDEEEEEEEAEEEDDEEPETFTVKVEGQDEEVTLDELLQGYSRTADYTRKTQQLAEERAALSQAADEIAQEREVYGQRLEMLGEALAQSMPQEPNWSELKAKNPEKYAQVWAEWQQQQGKLKALAEERTRVAQQNAEHVQQKLAEHVMGERDKLIKAVPGWDNDATRKEEQDALIEYAKSEFGFTNEDLGSVTDHRLMLMLRKAMLHDQLQEKKKSVKVKKQKKVKRLKPGTPQPRTAKKRRLKEKRKRAVESGKVDDAAAAIFDMLED